MTALLAKSRVRGRELSLAQHLSDTDLAAAALFRAGTRWASAFLRFHRLEEGDHPTFLLHLRLAALLHDLGKANEGFLSMLTGRHGDGQPFRHEHLSALVLAEPSVRVWFTAVAGLDLDLIVAAVLSHHLKASQSGRCAFMKCATATPTRLYFDDPQVVTTWERIAALIGRDAPNFALPRHYCETDDVWQDAYDGLFDRAARFARSLTGDPRRLRLCMALKAGLIAADSVASAAFRNELPIEGWIEGVAHGEALDPDAIQRDIIGPRIAEIEKVRPFTLHAFQRGAAKLGPRALLLAGCGMGKTLAAWCWADSVAKARPIGRVIFLYPTRGTATEGFRDYVGHAPEGTAALVHGTATYELEGMQSNPPESLDGKVFAPDEAEARLFALSLWSKRYFSATVDQFLSFIEHGYGGLCLLPAMADAAIVFDEVHSYDASMWNALVTFLETFDVPALCMTATLPPSRRAELAKHLAVYPDQDDLSALPDLEQAEQHPRYQFAPVADDVAAFERAIAARREGNRVLWVVNTVRRCQDLAARIAEVFPDVIAYHSRFKLEDRQSRHRAAVEAFRAPQKGEVRPAIAVTTQVCEMSLDLDADVLITEHAPISSLVQRFGRANRHLGRGPAFRAGIVTYPAESHLPYDRAELDAARRFLDSVAGRDVSQRDLAEGLMEFGLPQREAEGLTRFTAGGFFATPGPLRDSDDSGCQAILDADLDAFVALVKGKRSTAGLCLTVPRAFAGESDTPKLTGHLRIAEAHRYSRTLGFIADRATTSPSRTP